MEIIYLNRHNDEIKFKAEEDTVKVTGYSEFIRTGYNRSGTQLDFVDFPGGPWIHLGMGLGIIDPLMTNLKVKKIERQEDHFVLHVNKIK
jgi:hypothetical protein